MLCEQHDISFDKDDTCPGCDAVDAERARIEKDLRDEYSEQLAKVEWLLVSIDRVIEIVKNGGRQ